MDKLTLHYINLTLLFISKRWKKIIMLSESLLITLKLESGCQTPIIQFRINYFDYELPVIARAFLVAGPREKGKSHDATLSTSKGPTFDPLTRRDPNTAHGTDVGR